MAICLRRALASRGLLSLYGARHFSGLSSLTSLISNSFSDETSRPNPGFNGGLGGFNFSDRRGFAKGRKQKEQDEGDTVQAVATIGPAVKSAATSQMEAAVVALARELSKLRTGRAQAGMLDHIIVDSGGVKVALNRVAVVSVIDPQTLSVTPYDPSSIKSVEHAIISSPLGINPRVDGQRVIVPIPRLTKESVQALCKLVAKSAEDMKQSIRRARQKALDTIKKSASSMSKDDVKRLEKEVDEITKKFTKSADDMCKAKEKEISS
ncbi:ribosome-recycling factor [Carex littledalei]|uniref:Ribosome-recycling factor, chloroplastic n=1 Tax=Carex littledalei TaxID=544730 RepID=A0A833RLX7_9POAL|nr:ribosome-recycling factor [Carex littledalei]